MAITAKVSRLETGDRIQHNGSRGTVRYIGQVEGHGSKQWVGVEWDEASRGKHSGTYGGRAYFACAPGAGSFVKLDKLGNGGRTNLLESIRKRYTEDALDTTFRGSLVVVGGGLVSIEACDEKRCTEVALSRLRVVDVSGMGVARVMEEALTQMLPEVRELRIAKSLFSGVGCVLEAMDAFPRLQLLDASRNVLEASSASSLDAAGEKVGIRAEALKELVLNHCVVSWKTVGMVCGRSTNLQTLRLHNCKLESIEDELQLTDKLRMLQTLDLDGNELKWDDVILHIGKLENLREVYLSDNKLHDTDLPTRECLTQVKILSLANNALDGWRVITWLHNISGLKELRIRGNPVTSEEEEDERSKRLTWRMRVIGRISGIEVLDGSTVNADERILCEKRYMYEEIASRWVVNADETRLEHPRAQELYKVYGLGSRIGEIGGMRSDMVRVRLVAGENVVGRRKCIVRDMPRGAEMSRVRAVGRRLLGVKEECCVGITRRSDQVDIVEWENDLSRKLGFWCSSDVSELCILIGHAV